MSVLRVVIVLFTCVVSGCVLPFPSSTVVAPAISGTVTDASSGQALRDVTVMHRFDEDILCEVRTDQHGHFAIKKLQQFHWGYLFGVALNYPLPHWKVFPATPVATDLHVTCPGYHPYHGQMEFRRRTETGDESALIPDQTEVNIQLVPMGDSS